MRLLLLFALLLTAAAYGQTSVGARGASRAPAQVTPSKLHAASGSASVIPATKPTIWRSQGGERWWNNETARGSYTWNNLDAWISAGNRNGIRLLYTLGATPSWANGGDSTHANIPSDWNTSATCQNVLSTLTGTKDCSFKEYVTAMMQHECSTTTPDARLTCFGGAGADFEMWNEFNSSGFYNTNDVNRTVTDGATVITGRHVTSLMANFTSADLNGIISGANIPSAGSGSFIQTIKSNTDVTINSPPSANGSGIRLTIYRPVTYMPLARMGVDAATIIRAYCGNCKIIAGSVSAGGDGYHNASTLAAAQWDAALGQFLDALHTLSFRPDAVSYHAYPSITTITPPPFPEVVYSTSDTNCSSSNTPNKRCRTAIKDQPAAIKTILATRPWAANLPIWETEGSYGYNAKLIGSNNRQAWTARWILMLAASGDAQDMWYSYNNQCIGTLYGTNGVPVNSGVQATSCSGDPLIAVGATPAGTAWATVADWLSGASFDAPCSNDASINAIWTCGINKSGKHEYIKWIQNTSTSPTVDVTGNTVYDVNGNVVAGTILKLEIRPQLIVPN